MKLFSMVVFDDWLNATSYTPCTFEELLAEPDKLAIHAVADRVGGVGLTLTVTLEHSGDGINWVQKNASPEIDRVSIAQNMTNSNVGNDDGTRASLPYCRLKVEIQGGSGGAHVKITVCGKTDGFVAPPARAGASSSEPRCGGCAGGGKCPGGPKGGPAPTIRNRAPQSVAPSGVRQAGRASPARARGTAPASSSAAGRNAAAAPVPAGAISKMGGVAASPGSAGGPPPPKGIPARPYEEDGYDPPTCQPQGAGCIDSSQCCVGSCEFGVCGGGGGGTGGGAGGSKQVPAYCYGDCPCCPACPADICDDYLEKKKEEEEAKKIQDLWKQVLDTYKKKAEDTWNASQGEDVPLDAVLDWCTQYWKSDACCESLLLTPWLWGKYEWCNCNPDWPGCADEVKWGKHGDAWGQPPADKPPPYHDYAPGEDYYTWCQEWGQTSTNWQILSDCTLELLHGHPGDGVQPGQRSKWDEVNKSLDKAAIAEKAKAFGASDKGDLWIPLAAQQHCGQVGKVIMCCTCSEADYETASVALQLECKSHMSDAFDKCMADPGYSHLSVAARTKLCDETAATVFAYCLGCPCGGIG